MDYCLWKAASGKQVCPCGECERLSCRCSPTSLQQWAAAGWTARTQLSIAFPLGSKEIDKSSVRISQRSQVLSLSAAGLLRISQLASNYPAASEQGCWGILVNQHPKRNSLHPSSVRGMGLLPFSAGVCKQFCLPERRLLSRPPPRPCHSMGSRYTLIFRPLTQHELLGLFYTSV